MSSLKLISNNLLEVAIDPVNGTGIKSLYFKKNNRWFEVMPDTRKNEPLLDACSFLMIPYSNRIKNGTFFFEDKKYYLNYPERHSIHGDVRKRQWEIETETEDKLRFSFNSSDYDNINWPWPFHAAAQYSLEKNRFISVIEIKNLGSKNMPAGCGWHPFFNRKLTDGDSVYMKMQVESVYPDTDGDCIPCAPPVEPEPEQDFTQGKFIDPEEYIDSCFSGYNGNGYIHWTESNIKLNYSCSENCSHLIIFNPDKPFFAVEPVTNANDGVNLFNKKGYNSGIKVLAPGKKLTAKFIMEFV
ncbi:MAG: hypothetical protein K9L78_02840 [Victivallales bacterium]|nr:hypothetical protein [Victivallales bacterium]MCF7889033.1 hypothetical protein [Victivallales bacterium]